MSFKKMPKVSIIVPTYNAANFIEECLDSIINQSYKNIEVIVSDDFSTDGTQKILEKYRSNSNFVLKFNKKNIGVTANANQCLAHCKGKYISLFAGDDIMLKDKIRLQVNYMMRDPDITISYHPVELFDSETNKSLFITNQSSLHTPLNFIELISKPIPGPMSIMIRRDSLPAGGFNEAFPNASEWLLYIEISAKGKLGFLPKTLVRYRKHDNQFSNRAHDLLSETHSNLEYVVKKFPEFKNLSKEVKKGKARHIAGEAYRRLMKGQHINASYLFIQAINERVKVIYFLGSIIALLPIPSIVYRKLRYFFKNYF